MAEECQHGQLERSCDMCERDSEIARLSSALNKIAEISNHCPYDANEASYKLGMVHEIAQLRRAEVRAETDCAAPGGLSDRPANLKISDR